MSNPGGSRRDFQPVDGIDRRSTRAVSPSSSTVSCAVPPSVSVLEGNGSTTMGGGQDPVIRWSGALLQIITFCSAKTQAVIPRGLRGAQLQENTSAADDPKSGRKLFHIL